MTYDQKKKNEETAAAPPATEASTPEERLKKCEAERQEYLDGWKRARADFINYQKDEARRFEEFAKFASAALLEDLLLVLDSFDLAIAEHAKNKGDIKGMLMGFPAESCARLASVVAAYVVETYGTQTHKFTMENVKDRYKKTYGVELSL